MGELRKSTKRFVVSTEAENVGEFYVRTEGIELGQYEKNPLLLWMHQRPKGKSRDEILPMGNVLEVRKENNQITGIPAFDEEDWFAMTIYKKVENGTIRMMSAGLRPIEWRRDEAGKLWLWRSALVEISLCDIGSNPEALAVKLYDENEELITLSADYLDNVIQNPKDDMSKLIQLSPEVLPLLKLADGATPEQIQAKIQNLVTLADSQKTTIDTLTTEKSEAVTAKEKAEQDLVKLQKETSEKELVELVDQAIEDRKITADQKDDFMKLSLDQAKSILDKMKGAPTVQSQLQGSATNQSKASEEWVKLSYDEMDEKELLPHVKREAPDLFVQKFEEKFGEKPDTK